MSKPQVPSASASAKRPISPGFSLIEMLIAITVLIAIAAIALPALTGRLSAATSDSAAAAVRDFVHFVSAQAQLRSQPLEVIYTDTPAPALMARVFRPDAEAEVDGDPDAPDRAIDEAWAHQKLPTAARITSADLAQDASEQEPGRPLRLAILLPDGSALPGDDAVLATEDADDLSLTIDPWTAQVTFIPMTPQPENPRQISRAP